MTLGDANKPRSRRKMRYWLEQMEADNPSFAEKIALLCQKGLTIECKRKLSNEEEMAYYDELRQQLKEKMRDDAQHHKRLLRSLKTEFHYLKWSRPDFELYLTAGTCRWRAAFDILDMVHSRLSGFVRDFFHAKQSAMVTEDQKKDYYNLFVQKCNGPFKGGAPGRWTYFRLAAFISSDPNKFVQVEHSECADMADRELQYLAARKGYDVDTMGDIRMQIVAAFSGPFPLRNLDSSSSILMLQNLDLRAKVLEDVQNMADYSDFRVASGLIKLECYLQLRLCHRQNTNIDMRLSLHLPNEILKKNLLALWSLCTWFLLSPHFVLLMEDSEMLDLHMATPPFDNLSLPAKKRLRDSTKANVCIRNFTCIKRKSNLLEDDESSS